MGGEGGGGWGGREGGRVRVGVRVGVAAVPFCCVSVLAVLLWALSFASSAPGSHMYCRVDADEETPAFLQRGLT